MTVRLELEDDEAEHLDRVLRGLIYSRPERIDLRLLGQVADKLHGHSAPQEPVLPSSGGAPP